MSNHTRASWLVYALGALCIGAVLTAVLIVGPTSQSAAVQRRVVTVARGVVQSTVSGSGNIQAASQLDLGFKTSGVVQRIYVSAGQHVTDGQLVAELDPQSAAVTLEAGRARLQAAQASLAQEEEDEGESSGQSSGAQGSGEGSAGSSSDEGSNPKAGSSASAGSVPAAAGTASNASTTRKESAATRAANLASARAAVRSDTLSVESDEQAVQDTKLYAPSSGTIVSLEGEVGESVAGGGTSKAASSSESSSSGTGSTAGGGAGSGGSSSASSSSFAVLSDLSSMQLVVPLSESEIVHVHAGQPATVTVEALEGSKLAAEVIHVATLPSSASSSSGVVDYDVTFQLEQLTGGVKPGMSASAEVVVKQAEGVNVPTRAISGGAVTVVHGTSETRRAVVTGLAGDSTTIIDSGLEPGEQVALPVASTSSGASSLLSRLGRSAGGTLGGGLGGGVAVGGFAGAGGGGGFPGGGRGGG